MRNNVATVQPRNFGHGAQILSNGTSVRECPNSTTCCFNNEFLRAWLQLDDHRLAAASAQPGTGLIVKDTTFEFLPLHEVVDITPTPPEMKFVPPSGGLNTNTSTAPG